MEENSKHNKFYVNFNDRDNPVPGSAADIAKRSRDARKRKVLDDNMEEFAKACEAFPAFARLLDTVLKKEG